MNLKPFMLLIILGVQADLVFTQAKFSVGVNTALDYVMTPTAPSYMKSGNGDQFRIRYGLNIAVEVSNRFRLGAGIDKYSRKEQFDCVYFPTPNNPPQRAWSPLFNDSVYGCEYSLNSRISFVEIPITVHYDIWKNEDYTVHLGGGYGFQFLTKRATRMVDLLTGEELIEQKNSFFLMSGESIRFCLGGEKKISEKIKLGISLMYRSDSFRFRYQSFGLNSGLRFSI